MSKDKLIKLIENMSESEADTLYRKLSPKKQNKILDRKTYMIWLKLTKLEKDLLNEFKNYEKFHKWLIKQHGYGKDGMQLSCISLTKINKETLFFLPSRLAGSIRPHNLEYMGVLPKNVDFGKVYRAVVNKKHIGTFDTHEQAQQAARKAMVARIHAIMEECKADVSKEAYEAIKNI